MSFVISMRFLMMPALFFSRLLVLADFQGEGDVNCRDSVASENVERIDLIGRCTGNAWSNAALIV